MKYPVRSFLLFVVFTLLMQLSAIAAITLQRLGDLPGGSFHSEANDVSDDGRTVVGRSVSSFKIVQPMFEGFVWELKDDELTPLGDLTPEGIPSHTWSSAYGISGDGYTIAGFAAEWDTTELKHYLWPAVSEGGYEFSVLAAIYGETGFDNSAAFGISKDGRNICGYYQIDSMGMGAFLWQAGFLYRLDGGTKYPDYVYGAGNAVARVPSEGQDGQVIVAGRSYDTSFWTRAAYWSVADHEVMLTFVTNSSGEAHGICSNARFIVGFEEKHDAKWPFIYDREEANPRPKYLGWLPGIMWVEAEARDVTTSGDIIVGWCNAPEPELPEDYWGPLAVKWTRRQDNTTMFDIKTLNEIVDEAEIHRGDFQLVQANAITDDGETIVGIGYSPDKGYEAFRLGLNDPDESGPTVYLGANVDENGIARTSSLGLVNVGHAPEIYSYDLGGYVHCAEETITDQGAWFFFYNREDSD